MYLSFICEGSGVWVGRRESDCVCSIRGRQRENPKITFTFSESQEGIR